MDMSIEKERQKVKEKQAEMYINYLSNIFSQQPQEKPSPEYLRAKKEFESLLIPESSQGKQVSKSYEWDFNPDEYIEHKQ